MWLKNNERNVRLSFICHRASALNADSGEQRKYSKGTVQNCQSIESSARLRHTHRSYMNIVIPTKAYEIRCVKGMLMTVYYSTLHVI